MTTIMTASSLLGSLHSLFHSGRHGAGALILALSALHGNAARDGQARHCGSILQRLVDAFEIHPRAEVKQILERPRLARASAIAST
jgi:hypothetical protein